MKTIFFRLYQILLALAIGLALFCLPLTIHADGGAPNLAYVAGTAQGISIIDIAQQKVSDHLALDSTPDTILLSIDGRILYVTQPARQRLIAIATKTRQELCSINLPGHPSLLALDPGTNTLYVAGTASNRVTGIDPLNCKVKRTVQAAHEVTGLAIAVVGSGLSGGNGNELWVADGDSLSIFNSEGKQLVNLIVEGGPHFLCIPAGPTAYMTTQQGTVRAVAIKTRHLFPPLLTSGNFGPMDYDGTTGEIYVPDTQHSQINVLTPISEGATTLPHEPGRTIHVDASPQSIAITSDGQFGFAALSNGTVTMLDIPARQTVKTFSVGGTPRFIITGLYPSLLSLTPQQSSLLNILLNSLHYIAAGVIIIVGILVIRMPKPQRPQPKL